MLKTTENAALSSLSAPRIYEPSGLLALDPQAFGLSFALFAPPPAPFELMADGAVAVVRIDGPLQHSIAACWDSYAGIRERVAAALASDAKTVVLRVSSPGGDVFGCFDTSRAIRAMARASGKRLVGFTEANACSSAYALISAADEISASDSSVLGSIGVIATAVDASEQAAAQGVRVSLITSGARKGDGNPMVKLSPDAKKAMQTSVDAMASVFFGLVREHRGIEAEPLEAATFVGTAALEAKLCDRIESFDSLLERIAASGVGATLTKDAQGATSAAAPKDSNMSDDKKDEKPDARKALAAAAESDDPKEKARAARALKAYDEDKDEKAEDEKDKPSAKAEDGDKDEEKEDAKKAKAKAAAAAILASSQADARIAALEAVARSALFAARPDLPAAFVKACASLDVETIQELIAAAPKLAPTAGALAGTLATPPARGAGGNDSDRLPKAQADELSLLMGLADVEEVVSTNDGVIQSFGVKRIKG